MDRRKLALTVAMGLMAWLLTGCSRGSDEARELKGAFYPLDLALVCDWTTPSPLKSGYPTRDVDYADGTACIERNSGADALTISKIDIRRDNAFRDPVYEIHFHIARKDWERMDAAMSKAMRSRRFLAYVVHGSVVARALVMGLPQEGVIEMGGYDGVKDAEAVALRFEVPRARKGGANGSTVN